jgi:hypothetical protein
MVQWNFEINQPGRIGTILNGLVPPMLNRLPGNIEWIHFIVDLCKDLGSTTSVREHFSEADWNQFDLEMLQIVQSLPPKPNQAMAG